ncbi:hypothetical protein L2E82_49664 [Cichorium intybus]|uniref:Uncharacterized protein n=1 Tax=Cichorium intybus TaxID=13427 RepID=A0ACB8Z227_CICIN|nr:hypothetical protein L2E82_49664 [Cichorium intybus]
MLAITHTLKNHQKWLQQIMNQVPPLPHPQKLQHLHLHLQHLESLKYLLHLPQRMLMTKLNSSCHIEPDQGLFGPKDDVNTNNVIEADDGNPESNMNVYSTHPVNTHIRLSSLNSSAHKSSTSSSESSSALSSAASVNNQMSPSV